MNQRLIALALVIAVAGFATSASAQPSPAEILERVDDNMTIETAYSAGYFEWPRESSGEAVADLLDITQPTFNKHLRAAEREAFSLLLSE